MSYVMKHMTEGLKDHVLEEFPAGERIRAFYLRKKDGSRMMSTLILFTPEGIWIGGDLCPTPGVGVRGVMSTYGYGIDWFSADDLDERYLCSKFMGECWQLEAAVRDCEDRVREEIHEMKAARKEGDRDEARIHLKNVRRWRAVRDDLGDEGSVDACYDAMRQQALWDGEDMPGYDYPWGDAGWLCAIQRRFSELIKAKEPVGAAS